VLAPPSAVGSHGQWADTMQVEFLGIARTRAGVSTLDVHATTLGQLLGRLAADIPALAELIVHDRLHPALAASLNGDRFVSDPRTPLEAHDCVLILSADAGG
jgi:molybdopterin converting factor small subunit